MKTKRNRTNGVPAIAIEGERALRAAVAEVVAEHKRTGQPLAVWHNGRVVMLDANRSVPAVREKRGEYRVRRRVARKPGAQ